MVNNICIGIVSYLPDLEPDRSIRQKRILTLINDCDTKLRKPIIIIALNWKDFSLETENSTITIYKFTNKLGITKARKQLRKLFIDSSYDYIIMMDDDMELNSEEVCLRYLSEITSPNDFYYVPNFLINYCCISKKGFKLFDFDTNINPEDGTGFEDIWFVKKCVKYLHGIQFTAPINIKPRSFYTNDLYSTWEKYISSDIIRKNYKLVIV